MVRCLFLIASLLVATGTYAQRTAGLTQQPDASFTNYSAYKNAKKKYPQIQLVKDSLPPLVKANQNINYLTVNDQKLLLDVFRPKKAAQKLLPAVIIIHGGGWRSGSRTQHHPLAARLAEQGFVCFTPAYRLSTHALYPAAVQDLQAAISWIKANAKKYKVDTQRIVVCGFSAGGQLATLLGTTVPGIKAIVDIDGTLAFIHPESGEGDDSKSVSAGTNWFGYTKTEKPELWQQAGALAHVGSRTPPTLFINSSVDRMHAGRTDYINILNQYHIYNEVHTFPDSPHAFCLFEPWFTPTVAYITGFLNKVLK
ncbi:alpha/beta hydrolase [Mucilaginibacter sp. PAMB04274]|uniref:alpha/beta hydrolase n=1 Tax=Mucilaginibacter sp. PAMB04274 TaxID=3138568 RepID=UPI0031F70656